MAPNPQQSDAELRRILQELASGRLLVDEALDQVKRLQRAQVAAVALPSAVAQVTQAQRSCAPVVVGLILLMIGGIFAAVGLGFGWRSVRFEMEGVRAEAVIVRVVKAAGRNNNARPVAQYTVNGKVHETTGQISANKGVPIVGTKVQVLYNPADPDDAQIDTFVERWLFAMIFGGIGGVLSLIGLVLLAGKVLGRLFQSRGIEEARFSPE